MKLSQLKICPVCEEEVIFSKTWVLCRRCQRRASEVGSKLIGMLYKDTKLKAFDSFERARWLPVIKRAYGISKERVVKAFDIQAIPIEEYLERLDLESRIVFKKAFRKPLKIKQYVLEEQDTLKEQSITRRAEYL